MTNPIPNKTAKCLPKANARYGGLFCLAGKWFASFHAVGSDALVIGFDDLTEPVTTSTKVTCKKSLLESIPKSWLLTLNQVHDDGRLVFCLGDNSPSCYYFVFDPKTKHWQQLANGVLVDTLVVEPRFSLSYRLVWLDEQGKWQIVEMPMEHYEAGNETPEFKQQRELYSAAFQKNKIDTYGYQRDLRDVQTELYDHIHASCFKRNKDAYMIDAFHSERDGEAQIFMLWNSAETAYLVFV